MSYLKTPADWCLLEGVEILDPDGWRGVKGKSWATPITLAEFRERLATCTQRSVPKTSVRMLRIERYCEVMHDAYEKAAVGAGWETQQASRKPWADVPEANKATMRAAVAAVLDAVDEEMRS